MSDGALVTAVANTVEDPNCGTLLTNGHSPLIIPTYAPSALLAGHVSPDGALRWQSNALALGPINLSLFDAFNDSGFWGLTFDDGSVRVVSSLDAEGWTTVEQGGGGASYHSAARAGLAIYPSWSTKRSMNVLKGWSPGSASSQELYAGSMNVVGVALSDDSMAWIGVGGPGWSEGTYETFRFYWSPTARSASEVSAVEGPTLPIVNSRRVMDVANDLVAVDGCWTRENGERVCRVTVVRRSSREPYFLKPPDGMTWSLLAVGNNEVLLAENSANPVDPTHMHRLTRIRGENLSAWHESP